MPARNQTPPPQANAAFIAEIRRAVSEEVSAALAKTAQPDRLLKIDEVRHITGMCQTNVYECKPLRAAMIKVGRSSLWPASKVHAFVESLKAQGGAQ